MLTKGTVQRKVIKGKFGKEKRGRGTQEMKGRHGVGLWKAIRGEWVEFGFNLGTKILFGNSRGDEQIGESFLKEPFPFFIVLLLPNLQEWHVFG